MRADRLITIVLLLQQHRERTARQLADELAVSVRTIYRDVDALCTIGIPIYADHGPAGGYRLVEDYRNELNGLTRDERTALHVLELPEPLQELAVGKHLRNALLKLAASAPATQRVLLDWSAPEQPQATPGLQRVYDAILADRCIRLRYRLWGHLEVQLDVAPYGLVLHSGVWWLVAESTGRLRAFVVADLASVEVLPAEFSRPPDFDLKASWAALREALKTPDRAYQVTVRAAPHLSPSLLHTPDHRVTALGSESDGWQLWEVAFADERRALTTLLGLGGAVEVVVPEALRLTLQDYAVQILRRYGHSAPEISAP